MGDGAGLILGMNLAQTMNPQTAATTKQSNNMTFDEQIEMVKKFKELMDVGILSKEEFDAKKKEIMGL